MSAIATFDFNAFATRYPEFAALDPALAQMYWEQAGLYFDNTGRFGSCSPSTQQMLLNMLVAHIAALSTMGSPNGITPGSPQLGIVGRISSASEGSVSLSTELKIPDNAAWFGLTRYGLDFWQATNIYRRGRWRPGPVKLPNPYSWPWI